MKDEKHKIRPWRYTEEPEDETTRRQREIMEEGEKGKPNMKGVYRR
jgi:hypothetical protein